MLAHLTHKLHMLRWDGIVMWHAVTCRWTVFRDAPMAVVERWAGTPSARFAGHPEIQDAIGYAQAELSSRQREARRLQVTLRCQASAAAPRCDPAPEGPSRTS